MKKTTVVAIVVLTVGMAQAAVWTATTTDWNSTNAWDTGDVPNGYGEWAQIKNPVQPNLGGQTITLGRSANYSLQTTGVGNRIFSNGALIFEREPTDTFANDLHLAASGVNSFQVPLTFTRTAPSTVATRIKLHETASQVTFVEPITWSNTQLQFLNKSTTGNRRILVKNTVTGSTSGKSIWISPTSANSVIVFQNAISATTNNVELQIANTPGTVIFDNATVAVADSSLSNLRFFGGKLQVNQDDQVASGLIFASNNAKWDLNGHSNQNTRSLRLANATTNGTLTIDFSDAAGESLWFEDSSANAWVSNNVLDLTGFVLGTDELRFGTDANGLTATQLGQIRVDGAVVPRLRLDGNGYLSQTPLSIGAIDIEILSGGTTMALSWSNSVGLSYGVETNIDLVYGQWGIVQSNLTGVGSSISYTGSTSAAQNFYRVILD